MPDCKTPADWLSDNKVRLLAISNFTSHSPVGAPWLAKTIVANPISRVPRFRARCAFSSLPQLNHGTGLWSNLQLRSTNNAAQHNDAAPRRFWQLDRSTS